MTLRVSLDAYTRHPVASETIALATHEPFVLGRGPVGPRARSFQPFEIAFHSLLSQTGMPREVLVITPTSSGVRVDLELGERGMEPFRIYLDHERQLPALPATDITVKIPRSRMGFELEVAPVQNGPTLHIAASFGEAGIPTEQTANPHVELLRARLIRVFNRAEKASAVLAIALRAADPTQSHADIVHAMTYGFEDAGIDGVPGHVRQIFRNTYVWIRIGDHPVKLYPSRNLPSRSAWVTALRQLGLESVACQADDRILPPEQMSYREWSINSRLASLAQRLRATQVLTAEDLPNALRLIDGAR